MGNTLQNCYPDNGNIHIVCNDHNLGVGQLRITLLSHLPNTIYPDGTQDIHDPIALDIELVTGQGDCPTTAEIQAIAPFIKGDKGDPFTYQDLTTEQKAELQRPALEAAIVANAAAQKADTAATQAQTSARNADTAAQAAQTATNDANQAETQRQTAETARVNAEQSRQTAETARRSDEITRQTQETARVAAEQQRATQFQGFQAAIDAKQDKLTTTQDLAISKDNQLAITDHGARRQFIEMWNSAWNYGTNRIYGKYDPDNAPDSNHPYMGNEIWMTYEEALAVMHNSVIYTTSPENLYSHKYPHCRTLLPLKTFGSRETFSSTFAYCYSIEVIRLYSGYGEYITPNDTNLMFYNCAKLKNVYGVLYFSNMNKIQRPAALCANLEHLYIKALHGDLILPDSPKWSLDSVQYIVQNATNTAAITITVHPDVYAKLIGDTTNEAAAALTPEELAQWQAILTAAVEKNISFATPT